MKLIIDIDEETYNRAKNEPSILCGMNDGLIYQSNMKEAIANGTPYNPTGDLISREALKEYARKVMCEKDFMTKIHLELFENIIDNAPTVEPERPQGEWVDYNNTFYKCPECGYLLEKCCPQCQTKIILPFCHCGADTQKGDKEK